MLIVDADQQLGKLPVDWERLLVLAISGVLEILFHDFAARKHAWLPSIEKIYLLLMHKEPDVSHQQECFELATKTEKAGVISKLEEDE